MKNWTIKDIMEWQLKTFKKATTRGQMAKWREEYDEFTAETKPSKKASELADMFIVACGVCNLNPMMGFELLHEVYEICMVYNISGFRLSKAINAKMEINSKRKWKETNGKYKHV